MPNIIINMKKSRLSLQVAPFIVLEHQEHCSGTVLNGVNLDIPEHIYVSLKHKFSCYSVFVTSIYPISCASSFFTYLDTYVCILTLNRRTIPCNWHIDQ